MPRRELSIRESVLIKTLLEREAERVRDMIEMMSGTPSVLDIFENDLRRVEELLVEWEAAKIILET